MARHQSVDPNMSFPALEEEVLARWKERDIFHRSLEARKDADTYVFYEGPPTANGEPGSHHVLSRVFKDIFPRYKTMCGYYVPRKAGWDCHGLPVELEIERELGITSKDDIEKYGIAKFNEKCRESVFAYVNEWNRLTERIGFWIDLDDPYVTMKNDYIESVWWSLKQIWDKDLLYRGDKVVPYCPRCGTPLSSHELALGYKEVTDPSVFLRFPVVESPADAVGPDDVLLVWTTTPWTLISNTAVAVNEDVTYLKVRYDSETLILAEPLAEKVLGEELEVLDRIAGSELVGTKYKPPFDYLGDLGDTAHRLYAADFVTTEDGTGLVHLAPAFGQDDLNMAATNDLPVVNPVDLDGTFQEKVTDFAGRPVKEADPDIIKNLDERGLLYKAQEYEHSYPHCWRCDTPLLYYATGSWYISTTEIRNKMIAENEEIGWHPEHIKHGRFGKWLEGNVDWALSRKRYWGTPLPIWECAQGHRTCIGSIEELKEGSVDELPGDLDLHRPQIDEVKLECSECGEEMGRVPDVIDAWYDSGSMPFAQWHYPFENKELFKERFPAEFICEAIDQTRGWFYSLLAISTLLFDQSSYRNVLCLGLILDPEGYKMSKSRGNVVVPWDVIERHGADAFRWYYLTSQAPWSGYHFSTDMVGESVRKFLLTLWNTYSFYVLYANVEDFDVDAHELPAEDRPQIDRWILSRLQTTVKKVRECLDDYDTTNAGKAIAEFTDDLSNWYVRRSRRRFWRGVEEPGAFLTLYECLETVSKLLAPFTPFISDEIYTNLTGQDSVHLQDYPEADESLIDEELEFAMKTVRSSVELGRAARNKAKAKVRQPLAEAVIVVDEKEHKALEDLSELVLDELNVKKLEFVEDVSELGQYEVKPNFKTLGPRFGSKMPEAKAAVEALEAAKIAPIIDQGDHVGIIVSGREESLGPDDLDLVMSAREGYALESQGSRAVAINVEIDDELRREGIAREIVHAVQGARKNAGLEVEDRIELSLSGDGKLIKAARELSNYIAEETLATGLEFDGEIDGHIETAEVDNQSLTINLKRA